ncbi:MAG: thiolase family protein [Pseudomonadota bacterium]
MRRAPLEAVIAGVGESPVGSVPELDALGLQRAAAQAALDDAGLGFDDVDGLLTTPQRVERWSWACGTIAEALGVRTRYLATLDLAGASGVAMAHHAAMAIATGQCETVLCVSGQNLLTFNTRGTAVQLMAEAGSEFEIPYGPLIPTQYALIAQRHMHDYGTTSEQLAEVAVAMRSHAALNPNAHKKELISVADVLASRMITTPLHVLDCSLVSDGAAAFVVTSRARARDLRRPAIQLLGHGYGFSHAHIGDYRTVTSTSAVQSGRDAFEMAGLAPADIDVAELYDCFTITVIVELEDLGFCAKGEGGRFVEGGRIRLGGELPVTTHGGLLSAGHPGLAGGMFHVVEGVRQLRGEAGARQVPGAEVALVHGNGGVLGIHTTAILGRT